MYVPLAPTLTAGQLRHRLVQAILAVDPEWAGRRYRRAVAGRWVCGYLAADGTATISGSGLAVDEAAAACARVDALAEQLRRAGHPGAIGQLRADVFLRLLDGRLTGLSTAEIITAMLAAAASPADAASQGADNNTTTGNAVPGTAGHTSVASEFHADGQDDDAATSHRTPSADPVPSPDPTLSPDPVRRPDHADDTEPDPCSDSAVGVDSGVVACPYSTGDARDPDNAGIPGDSRSGAAGREPGNSGVRVGIEICVGLPTVLGLDQRPGEIRGWGPVVPEVARAVVARLRGAWWRFAILDDLGHLLLAGTTRCRPRPAIPCVGSDTGQADVAQAEGGVVEVHITATELRRLAASPDAHPGWAPVIADLARRFADRHRLLAALDAHSDARLVRGALLRHVQIRDRGCVAPGCRRRAWACDVDHAVAHAAGGRTTAGNVGPLCPHHHALKHQGGWGLQQPEPGRFRWTSPLGQSYDTRGEPIMPPLPEPLPRPPGPEPAPTSGPRDIDGPTFDPRPKGGHRPPSALPPPRPRWRSSHTWPEDPDDPPPS